jgi:hypothetical protein
MEQWRQGKPLGWAEIAADDISYIDPNLPRVCGRTAASDQVTSHARDSIERED